MENPQGRDHDYDYDNDNQLRRSRHFRTAERIRRGSALGFTRETGKFSVAGLNDSETQRTASAQTRNEGWAEERNPASA
jgi:hypothetical protein